MSRRVVVAIDGPSASGKGTVGRRVAHQLGYRYIDTGAMYRAVALGAKKAHVSWEDGPGVADLIPTLNLRLTSDDPPHILLGSDDVSEAIRTEEIGIGASRVSRLPEVRAGLLALQRQMGEEGGVVMDGRDIGTVVFPRAEVKIYLTASSSERSRRRVAELRAKGQSVDPQQVEEDLKARDLTDMTRTEAPLTRAPDAIEVDTTGMTVDDVASAIFRQVVLVVG